MIMMAVTVMKLLMMVVTPVAVKLAVTVNMTLPIMDLSAVIQHGMSMVLTVLH